DAVRPLTDILAVQLLYAKRLNGDEVWELNFVLDDWPQSRLNLASHTRLRETLHQAERLAAFLGVPLLRHTEGAADRPSSRKRVDLSSAITVLTPSTSWHIKAAAVGPPPEANP